MTAFAVHAFQTIKTLLLEEYSFGQWVLLFFLYSFAGWCWEVMLYVVKERRFVNRGFMFGPILPIYGFGAIFIMMSCVPVEMNPLAVALVGMIAASLLEYVTGFAMEMLFHVRYWDYTGHLLSLKGYICLMSAATWAVFSVLLVCGVSPILRPYVRMVPTGVAHGLSFVLGCAAVTDCVFSVRRALDLRALLEAVERYAKEIQTLHGGLDGISDRVSDAIKALSNKVDLGQEAMAAKLERIAQTRSRVNQMIQERRIGLAESAKQRIAEIEQILSDAGALLPDTALFREEIGAVKAKLEHQRAEFIASGKKRFIHAQRTMRANPTASSPLYGRAFEYLRRRERGEGTAESAEFSETSKPSAEKKTE